MNNTAAQAPASGGGKRQLLIAAVLGLVSAVLIVVFLNSLEGDDAPPVVPSRSVVVASEAIDAGEEISASQLTLRELPETSIAGDSVTDQELVAGQVARYPIGEGEQVTASRLVDAPVVQALSFQIPKGLRGMTIPVSTNNTPAALIAPGDFVDVLISVEVFTLTGEDPADLLPGLEIDQEELNGAATLLQNIQVLSVERGYADTGVVYEESTRGAPPEEDESVSFITLAVTPQDAQFLWLAQTNGSLTVILRAFGDNEVVPLTPELEPLFFER